jgi:hypothetical protein
VEIPKLVVLLFLFFFLFFHSPLRLHPEVATRDVRVLSGALPLSSLIPFVLPQDTMLELDNAIRAEVDKLGPNPHLREVPRLLFLHH